MLKRLIVIFLAILGVVFLTILFLGCGAKSPTVVKEPDTVVIVVEPSNQPIIVRENPKDTDDKDAETEPDSGSGKEGENPVDKKKSRADKIREMRSKR